jgi:hypothetical protein
MTALADDMVVVGILQYPEIQLVMLNKALKYGIIKYTNNETRFLWDISKGILYRIRNDMYFVQHSYY